jgi:hypothetical protein
MTETTYPIAFDPANGRAHVKISGEISPAKIGQTYIAISMNRRWLEGDASIIWQLKNAVFHASFEFHDILEATQTAKHYIKPGKSAIVVEESLAMQERVAGFYKSIAATSTARHVAIFYSEKEALAWLDAEYP